jgi:hypothetical protein
VADSTGVITKKSSITTGMGTPDELLTVWQQEGACRVPPPFVQQIQACAAGGEAATRACIAAVQGDRVPATSRAMVFKWLKDTHLNAYPAALPVRDFQRGRLALARRVLKANGLPPDDEALLVELAFCLLGHAGLAKYFPMSHAVRMHGYTKPEQLSFDDIMFALDLHKSSSARWAGLCGSRRTSTSRWSGAYCSFSAASPTKSGPPAVSYTLRQSCTVTFSFSGPIGAS